MSSTTHPNTKTAFGGASSSACPYATQNINAASSDDDENTTTSSVNTTPPSLHPQPSPKIALEALSLAKSTCPAFQNDKCPFRDAKDSEDIKRTMLSVPRSHFDDDHPAASADGVGGASGRTESTTTTGAAGGPEQQEDGGVEAWTGVVSKKDGTAEVTVETTTTPAQTKDEKEKKKDISGPFRVALEHVHAVSLSLHHRPSSVPADSANGTEGEGIGGDGGGKKSFVLEGGCPFKTYYRPPSSSGNSGTGPGGKQGGAESVVPFVNAMEEFSLSAIMGRMADEMHKAEEEEENKGGAEEEEQDAAAIGAVPPSTKELASATVDNKNEPKPPTTATASSSSAAHLSEALKHGTAASHTSAENVHFVRNFIRGKIDKGLYAQLVTNLYYIYNELETQLNIHGPNHFPTLHYPKELSRTESLEDDMEYYHGFQWETQQKPTQATLEYVQRIQHIAQTEPLLLLSHGYTRYLGDLSGGQILARVARRALNLSRDTKDGLRFYYFELISNAKQFKNQYRTSLDELQLTSKQIDRLVAEANVAFVLNMRVFEELDVMGGVVGAKVRGLDEATEYLDRVLEEQARSNEEEGAGGGGVVKKEEDGSAQCPFAFLGGPNPHQRNDNVGGNVEKKEEKALLPSKKKSAAVSPAPTATTVKPSSEDVGGNNNKETTGRCPWPFIFFHDPVTGMKDFQTWVLIGLVTCWLWSYYSEQR